MELKVHEIQKSLVKQHMTPKHKQARKRIIDDETKILFSDILIKQINKIKRGELI